MWTETYSQDTARSNLHDDTHTHTHHNFKLWADARRMQNGGHHVITDRLRHDLDEGRVGVPCWLGVGRQLDLASNYD